VAAGAARERRIASVASIGGDTAVPVTATRTGWAILPSPS
jgi:hypothetical protein